MGPQVEQAYAGGLPNIDEDVYVGSNNLLKGIYTPLELKVYGQEVTETMTVDFSNYGTAVTATPPPANEVIPLSQLGNDLGSGLGGSSGNTGSTGNTGNTGNSANNGFGGFGGGTTSPFGGGTGVGRAFGAGGAGGGGFLSSSTSNAAAASAGRGPCWGRCSTSSR